MPTFKDIYKEPLERARQEREQILQRIAKVTETSPGTVKHWLAGTRQPSTSAKILAGIAFGCDPDELFPLDKKADDTNGDNNPTDKQAQPSGAEAEDD